MHLVRAATVAASILSVAPATAGAASVRVFDGGVEYRAAAGEANRIELFKIDGLTARVVDSGAVISAGVGCASVDGHTAVCTSQGRALDSAFVLARDGDDVIVDHGLAPSLDGGPGDDHIEAEGGGNGTLNGGGGHDVLLGGSGEEFLLDGDTSGNADSDVMDGREGGAVVSYADRAAPVIVDLVAGSGGGQGEGDVLRSVTSAFGGAGADILRGDDGENELLGGAGDDMLVGLASKDLLAGGRGHDRLLGGAGADFLFGDVGADDLHGGRGADRLDGGPGEDVLRGGPGSDELRSGRSDCGGERDTVFLSAEVRVVRPDCELIGVHLPSETYGEKVMQVTAYPVHATAGSLTFRVGCPIGLGAGIGDPLPMRGVMTLSARGQTVARGPIDPRAARRCEKELEDAQGPARSIRVRVRLLRPLPRTVTVSFAGSNVPDSPWRIVLGDNAGGGT